MSFLVLVAVLVLEHWYPLADRGDPRALLGRYAMQVERMFGGNESRRGVAIWLSAIAPLLLASWFVYALAERASPLLALLANIAALYFTMGFRRDSQYFAQIQTALKDNDISKARDALSAWRRSDCGELDREAVARVAVEEAFIASHHRFFAVVFWFVLLPGPLGAILYRLAMFLFQRWDGGGGPDARGSPSFARRAFAVLDWLPARLTAATFAVVGDFEDAAYCWRTQAENWPDQALGVVLASGAGALGVKLGMPIPLDGEVLDRPELGLGDAADEGHLDGAAGLVWRALVVWLILLLLAALAGSVT